MKTKNKVLSVITSACLLYSNYELAFESKCFLSICK